MQQAEPQILEESLFGRRPSFRVRATAETVRAPRVADGDARFLVSGESGAKSGCARGVGALCTRIGVPVQVCEGGVRGRVSKGLSV